MCPEKIKVNHFSRESRQRDTTRDLRNTKRTALDSARNIHMTQDIRSHQDELYSEIKYRSGYRNTSRQRQARRKLIGNVGMKNDEFRKPTKARSTYLSAGRGGLSGRPSGRQMLSKTPKAEGCAKGREPSVDFQK